MSVKRLLLVVGLVSLVSLSGCVSQQKRPVYACYFGEAMEEKCLQTDVDESRQLVCVDVAKNTHFDISKCRYQVEKKTYSFF